MAAPPFIICRLCLEVIPDARYEEIDNKRNHMIKTILPDAGLNVDRNWKLCEVCSYKVTTYYKFRCNFLQKINFDVLENCTTLDTENTTDAEQSDYFEYDYCCFCREIFESSHVKDVSNIVLKKCFREMRKIAHCNFKSCKGCLQILDSFYALTTTCANNSQKIQEYCSVLNISPPDVNVIEVYRFLSTSAASSDTKIGLTAAIELEDDDNKPLNISEEPELVESGRERETNHNYSNLKILKVCLARHEIPTEGRVFGSEKCAYEKSTKKNLPIFECAECLYVTNRKDNFKRHLREREHSAKVKVLEGGESQFETRTENALKQPLQQDYLEVHESIVEGQIFKCEVCAYATKFRHYLKLHLKKHESYTCAECNRVVKNRRAFRRHLLLHKSPALQCNECGFQTIHKNSLKVHLLTHKSSTDVKMFKCDECTFESRYEKALKRHSIIHKSPTEIKMFKCEECPFESRHPSGFKKHVLRHKSFTEIQIFKCNDCQYLTKTKYCLINHMILHRRPEELNMFKCNKCTYETARKASLQIHLLSHKSPTELKMFKCKDCPFEAKRKVSLEKHTLIHKNFTEVDTFKCAECQYETKRKCNLQQHMIRHQRPEVLRMFKCAECSFETKRKPALAGHLLTHKKSTNVNLEKRLKSN